jgi:hypothetical protein
MTKAKTDTDTTDKQPLVQLHVHKPQLVVSPKWIAKFSTGIDDMDWQQPL